MPENKSDGRGGARQGSGRPTPFEAGTDRTAVRINLPGSIVAAADRWAAERGVDRTAAIAYMIGKVTGEPVPWRDGTPPRKS
ncbi:hypothetical protein [Stratiformator vulcanicus]|uniref:Uncharacterized protein n=1 Tax=Stratiformator vulcanicus TaxID=2527980 RepID=A0A517R739_9PLAN|nr:hypothetical protein [Stratiformator vulcanicus]QDT39717.1 hypothetical protein Pan189_41260 [Stratiformator vulcanicus]